MKRPPVTDQAVTDQQHSIGEQLVLDILGRERDKESAAWIHAQLTESPARLFTVPMTTHLRAAWPGAEKGIWQWPIWQQGIADEHDTTAALAGLLGPKNPPELPGAGSNLLLGHFKSLRTVTHLRSELGPDELALLEMLMLSGHAQLTELPGSLLQLMLGWQSQWIPSNRWRSGGPRYAPGLTEWLGTLPVSLSPLATHDWSLPHLDDNGAHPKRGRTLDARQLQYLLRTCGWIDRSTALHGGIWGMLPMPEALNKAWTESGGNIWDADTAASQLRGRHGNAEVISALSASSQADLGSLERRLEDGALLRVVWGPGRPGPGAGESVTIAWAGLREKGKNWCEQLLWRSGKPS